MGEVSGGLPGIRQPVVSRVPAVPEPTELRQNEPDPMGMFAAGLKLGERFGVNGSLGFEEAGEAHWRIGHKKAQKTQKTTM